MPEATDSVVVFTPYPWGHALVSLRIVRPLEAAGFTIIHGNDYSVPYKAENIHLERIEQADVILIQREFVADLDVYKQILSQAHTANKPLVYEIDDLLLELPDDHPDRSIHYYTPSLLNMWRAILQADLVTTSTPILADYYRAINPNTRVLPNYLDDSLWPVLKTSLPQVSSTPVSIGYMGSNTHLPDLGSILPVLQHLLDRYGEQIRFCFWGGEPPEQIQLHPLVEWTPLQITDYALFADYFSKQKCDIFIAPLIDSPFNSGKSPIKYLEYSALGIPGVYSKVTPYESVIEQGRNGLLASTLDEWKTHIQTLIEDQALRHRIGQNARQDVLDHWLLSQHATEWKEAYLAVHRSLSTVHHPPRSTEASQSRSELASFITVNPVISIADQTYDWQKKQQVQIREKENTIRSLQLQLGEKEAYLQNLTHSTAWKLVQWLWRVRLSLAPHGSTRERYIKRFFHRPEI